MSVEQDIMNRIVTMLKADSGFDSIKVFFVGAPTKVAEDQYPNCEVLPNDSELQAGMTGSKQIWHRSFRLGFYALIPDDYTVTDRTATMTSYTTVLDLVTAARELFLAADKRTLNDLSGSNYVVHDLRVTQLDYGFANRSGRVSTFENFADVVITVRVTETY